MKIEELINKLKQLNPKAQIFFEEDGHNQCGESEMFALGFKCIYASEKEVTIVLQEN